MFDGRKVPEDTEDLAADGSGISAGQPARRLMILGTRGIPASHGGFETFAQYLALHLVAQGWEVEVACQTQGKGAITFENWRGVRLVKIPVAPSGSRGSLLFDLRAVLYALRNPGLVLTLGYNTAVFGVLLRALGLPNLINMDGLEWKRSKWPAPIKAWFWMNERIACWSASHLIADHPVIAQRLAQRASADKISCIAYCAYAVERPDPARIGQFGLEPGKYAIVVARPEPENSILEIVSAYSSADAPFPLVVLGDYTKGTPYQRRVLAAAGRNVIFPGAIYDKATVEALRHYARFYIHGHQTGGTNPSLVEALAAGSVVLAHDNRFNRWVAGPAMRAFADTEQCRREIQLLCRDDSLLAEMRRAALARHAEAFTTAMILPAYERLLASWLPRMASRARAAMPGTDAKLKEATSLRRFRLPT